MRDVTGKAASMKDAVDRPTGSLEHPQSGQPLHDMTGGNIWVATVLASAVSGSPNYNAVNSQLLNQGAAVLTMSLNQGLGVNPAALLAGAARAKQQLELAAVIEDVDYDPATGRLFFRIQNQTGHKLISGFPEGRRMFINIKAFDDAGAQIYEINPYDAAAGTLKGFSTSTPLDARIERYVDELVYEMQPSSTLSGEDKTFHFALADGRYKDNRIPPKGFRIAEAAARLSVPVVKGSDAPGLYTAAEYAGGYDAQEMTLPAGAGRIEVALYYQTTSREYIEFLRDEINGDRVRTLPDSAYVIQSDPFFSRLKAWGDTIWNLWWNNKDLPGAAPVLMTSTAWGAEHHHHPPGAPVQDPPKPAKKAINLSWSAGDPGPESGYRIYYSQAGKLQFRAATAATTLSYKDTGLTSRNQYCYAITAWTDIDDDGKFSPAVDLESAPSNVECAVAQ